ncbi:MAG: surface lipoprotein assembly modifier [Pseudomonadota bacterium]
MPRTAPTRRCPLQRLAALCCLVVLLSPNASRGQDSGETSTFKTTWSGGLSLGLEYDTNVSVSEVDLSSGESDYAVTSEFKLQAKRGLNDTTDLSASYSISQSTYQEFSRVDRLTQIAGANINKDLGSMNGSVSAYYIDTQLDHDGFLEFIRLSPALAGFISKRWFLRGAYVYSERTIDDRPERNADTQTLEFDAYYFHRGLRSYFNFGVRYRDEDTGAPELTFTGPALKARYIRRFNAYGRKAKLEASFRFEERDYSSPEPTIGEKRADNRWRWKVDLELPLTERIRAQAYYSYGDFQSNLPRADFTQTIVGTRLQFTW